MKVLQVIILICCGELYYCQNCQYFDYRESYGETIGRIEIENDFSGYYKIDVNMSVAAYLTNNEKVNLELISTSSQIRDGGNLVYELRFPIQNVLPKLTRLEFNQRVLCTGPPEQVRPGVGVTNFWSTHSYQTGGPVRRPNVQPTRRPTYPDDMFTYRQTQFYPTPAPVTWRQTPAITRRTPTQPRPTPTQPRPPPTQSRPTPTAARPTPAPPRAPSGNPVSEPGCGQVSGENIAPLIASTDDVEVGKIPWMAAIMYRDRPNSQWNYKCTGNLVSTRHVISAAHCIRLYNVDLIDKSNLLVVLGKVDIEDFNTGGVKMYVSNVASHPEYRQNTGHNDIAVFTLQNAVKTNYLIKPICIWEEDDDLESVIGRKGTVAGWGSNEAGTKVVAEAKFVKIPIVSQSECRTSNPTKFQNLVTDRTFCAGKRDGTGPCNGDSGAGFAVKVDRRWVLRGVVSRDLNDANLCDLNNYFVFADIAKSTEWLRSVIRG